MTHVIVRIVQIVAAFWLAFWCIGASAQSCPSAMFNPVTDVCWSCILPVTIGSMPIANIGSRPDTPNPSSPVCVCGANVGVSIGFWEPARLVEVVRTPYCFPGLGGLNLGAVVPAPMHGRNASPETHQTQTSFYQSHYYVYPLLYILGVIAKDPCFESQSFDLGYITEVDPTWADDSLGAIFNAEAFLFANPVTIAACAEDCLAASTNIGLPLLFWCAGCQGDVYPQSGWVSAHIGMVDSSMLLTQRLLYKLHKQGTAWRYNGSDALCGPVIDFKMDKSGYRSQMVAPTADSDCHALGASTIVWGTGKEYPMAGEDATYLLFRKRNCCETSAVQAAAAAVP